MRPRAPFVARFDPRRHPMQDLSSCQKAHVRWRVIIWYLIIFQNGRMMFAREPPVRPRGVVGGPMSPYSPSSPMNFSNSASNDGSTPMSPMKVDHPLYNPQSPFALKLVQEPLSPYSRRNAMDQSSPLSVESMSPHSPANAVLVNLCSPTSPSSTTTLSPLNKAGRCISKFKMTWSQFRCYMQSRRMINDDIDHTLFRTLRDIFCVRISSILTALDAAVSIIIA